MAYQHKEGQGSLFKNEKQNERQPDFRGSIMIKGVTYNISAWNRTSQNGRQYLSLQAEEQNGDARPNYNGGAGYGSQPGGYGPSGSGYGAPAGGTGYSAPGSGYGAPGSAPGPQAGYGAPRSGYGAPGSAPGPQAGYGAPGSGFDSAPADNDIPENDLPF